MVRTSVLALLMLSVVTVASEDPVPEATPAAEEAAAAAAEATPAVEELPALDCKQSELLDKVDSWSVDCVAMWLENLGFPELRTAFTGNKMDGAALKGLTMEKLAEDYGVSEEDQRKKIYYNLKDVMRKDNSSGNTNHYTQMLFWLLPFLAIYKYLTVKYDKQIAKAMKRYKKWQEARNPPKPVEPVVYQDGTNEWTAGLNTDLGGGKTKEKKPKGEKSPKEKRPKKSPKAD